MLYHPNLHTRYCRRTGANKGTCQGDIKYLNWSGPMCQKHAQQVCDTSNPPISLPQPIELDTSLPSAPGEPVWQTLRDHLKLHVRHHGGCPEERMPDDTTIMLVLGSEVISEITL